MRWASDVDRLGANHTAVHLGHGLGRLLRSGEADEAEALADLLLRRLTLLAGGRRDGLLLRHDACGRDGAVRLELLAQLVVPDLLVEVLDKEIDALVLLLALRAEVVELLLELHLALFLLLGATGEDLLVRVADGLVVQAFHCLGRVLGALEVDEAEAARHVVIALHDGEGSDRAEGLGGLAQLLLGGSRVKVLDVDVGEAVGAVAELGLALLLGAEVPDEDDTVQDGLAVDALDGIVRGLGVLEVDEAVALALAVEVHGDLARQDVTVVGEGV